MPRPKGLFATLRDWWRSKSPRTGVNPVTQSTDTTGTQSIETSGVSADATARDEVAPGRRDGVNPPSGAALWLDAAHDMFSFEVAPHFRWTSSAMSLELLRQRALIHQDAAVVELTRRAWPLIRTCDPSDPMLAEKTVNDALRAGWWYDDQEGGIHCEPSVRVRIDPALRAHVKPYHLSELSMDRERRLSLQRADNVKELGEKWIEVVRELERLGELTPIERRLMLPMVSMLVDADFAKVMQKLETARRSGTVVLAQVLDQAVKNHEQVGLFEYANAYDKALRAFCQQMGLTPFSWVDQAVNDDHGELTQ
ncbi:hypothetical protein [Streptomyces sp. NBC_01190]|uniref:hypothetical protein n=1 Tax=Streptomyces sp. NBC_01190 TaxID=2903767 RepID=UPI00386C0C3F|nr:P27 family phage terminase small subunit [Streptomyces sp. NBC_01190]